MNAIQWLGNDDLLRLVLTLVLQLSIVLGAPLCASWLCRRRTAARHAVCLCGLCAALACPLATIAARRTGIHWLAIPWPENPEQQFHSAADVSPAAPQLSGVRDDSPHLLAADTQSGMPLPFEVSTAAGTPVETPADATSPPHVSTTEHGQTPLPVTTATATADHSSPVSDAGPATHAVIRPRALATCLTVLLWFLGVVWFLLRWLIAQTQLLRIVREARPVDVHLIQRLLRDVGCPQLHPAQVTVSRTLPVPIVFGVFRPRVVIPETLLQPGAEAMLRDVLIHELSHVFRRDPLVNLLQRLATVLYWPHPLVHFVDRQLSIAREDLCDNHVLRHRQPADYARTLLQLSEGISPEMCPQTALAMLPRWPSLEQRVAALLDPLRPTAVRNARWLNGLIAAGAVCIGLAAAGIYAQGTTLVTAIAAVAQVDNADATVENTEPDPNLRLISGFVVDEDGQSVMGATVRFAMTAHSSSTVQTNARGHFELLIPPVRGKDEWKLLANDSSSARMGFVEVLNDDEIELKTEIALAPARTVTVKVRDSQGNAVPGARVAVVGSYVSVGESLTDERGVAIVKYPQQVEVAWVIARKDGVGFDYFENYSATGQQHFGPLAEEVHLTLQGARSVTCRVVDSSGQGIAGAFVCPRAFKMPGKIWDAAVSGAVAVTADNSGQAHFDWLPAQFEQGIAFYVYHPAYRCAEQDVIRPSDGVEAVVLRMRKLASITGRVTDLEGRPAPGIRVIASGIGRARIGGMAEARTAADGTYRLAVVPDAAYMLSVSDPDFAAAPQSTNLIDEGASVDDVHLTLIRGTLVTGRVTAGSDDAPVSGASVALRLTGEPLPNIVGREVLKRQLHFLGKSDDTGRYAFLVPPGEYCLTVWGGQIGEAHNVHVPENGTVATIVVDHHFATPANRPLRGRVVKSGNGTPLPHATVFLAVVGGQEHATTTRAVSDADGRFEIDRTGPRHLVYAVSEYNSLAGFAVSDAEATEIKLELSPAATVVGQLLGRAGQPLADVEVAGLVRSPDAVSQTVMLPTRTDGEGRYRIPGVAVGSRFKLLPQRTHFGKNPTVEIKSAGEVEIETFKVPHIIDADDAEGVGINRLKLVADIDSATDDADRLNLLHRALEWAEEMLADPTRDPKVHLNAAILLSELNARPADKTAGSVAVPWSQAHKPLLRFLLDKRSSTEVRIWSANGLGRICRDADNDVRGGELSADERWMIIDGLLTALHASLDECKQQRAQATPQELKGPELTLEPDMKAFGGKGWYQMRLVEALGNSRVLRDANGRARVYDELLAVCQNQDANWIVRGAAVSAMSRLPLDDTIDLQALLLGMRNVVRDLKVAYGSRRDQSINWRNVLSQLFLPLYPGSKDPEFPAGSLWSLVQHSGNSAYAADAEDIYDSIKDMLDSTDKAASNVPESLRNAPADPDRKPEAP